MDQSPNHLCNASSMLPPPLHAMQLRVQEMAPNYAHYNGNAAQEHVTCYLCTQVFVSMDHLKNHLTHFHGQNPYHEQFGYSPLTPASSIPEQPSMSPCPPMMQQPIHHSEPVHWGSPLSGPLLSPQSNDYGQAGVQIEPYFSNTPMLVMPQAYDGQYLPQPQHLASTNLSQSQNLNLIGDSKEKIKVMPIAHEPRQWKCDDCSYVTAFRSNLKRHCLSFHHRFTEAGEVFTPERSRVFSDTNNDQLFSDQFTIPNQIQQQLQKSSDVQQTAVNAQTVSNSNYTTESLQCNMFTNPNLSTTISQPSMWQAISRDDTLESTSTSEAEDDQNISAYHHSPASMKKELSSESRNAKRSNDSLMKSHVQIPPQDNEVLSPKRLKLSVSVPTTKLSPDKSFSHAHPSPLVFNHTYPEMCRGKEQRTSLDKLDKSFLEEISDGESTGNYKVTPEGSAAEVASPKQYSCDECDFSTEFPKSFKRHTSLHSSNYKFKCKICSFTVSQMILLKSHIKNHHKNRRDGSSIKAVNCEDSTLVESSFPEEELSRPDGHISYSWIRENYIEKTADGLKCNVCHAPFQFKNFVNFREHVYAKHLNLKPYTCKFCSYASSYRTSAKRHELKCATKAHAKRTLSERPIDLENNTDEVLRFCSYCNFKTTNLDHFKKHVLIHDTDEAEPSATINTAVEEDEDDLPLTHLKSKDHRIKQVSLKVEEPIPEDVINVVIVKNTANHAGTNLLQCDECDFKSKVEQEFKRHRKCHTIPNAHKCDICSYSARFSHIIRIHKHNHHKKLEHAIDAGVEAETFSCQTCRFKTPYEDLFKAHLLHHETSSTNKCYICNFSANQPHITKRHEMKDHTEEERNAMASTSTVGKVTRHSQKQVELQQQLRLLDEKQQELQRNIAKEGQRNNSLEQPNSSTVHKCQECSFSSVLEQELQRHMIHHNVQSSSSKYHCNKCSFGCDTKNLIEVHCDHHHFQCTDGYTEMNLETDISSIFTCKTCQFTTEERSALNLHESRHGATWKWKCSRCNYAAPLESSVLEHERLHHDYISSECHDVNKCHLCDFVTQLKDKMDKHNQNHLQDHRTKCPLCSYSVSEAANMLMHFKNDHEENQNLSEHDAMQKFNRCVRESKSNSETISALTTKRKRIRALLYCSKCNYSTAKRNRLKNHMSKHSSRRGNFKFACNICNYSANQEFIIKAHLKKYHADQDTNKYEELIISSQQAAPDKAQVTEKKKWHCNECLFTTGITDYIKNHQMRHSVSSQFQCCLCSYSANSQKIVTVHQARHHEKQELENCHEPRIFEKKTLEENIKGRLNDDKPSGGNESKSTSRPKYSCTKCDFVASGGSQHKQHFICHVKKSLFTCGFCKYSVKTSRLLKFHKKHHHKNSLGIKGTRKMHTCDKCEFTTHRKYLLQNHALRHGSNSRFTCKYCDYSVLQLSFVIFHQRNYHPKIHNETSAEPSISRQIKTESSECHDMFREKSSMPSISTPNQEPKKFTCPDCNFATDFRSNFKKHRTHHFKDPSKAQGLVSCSLCSYFAQSQNAITKHMAQQHGMATEQHSDLDLKLGQHAVPLTPDSSERSGSEVSNFLPLPLSERSNEEQATVQQKLVRTSNQYVAKSNGDGIADSHGAILHHIPSSFSNSTLFHSISHQFTSEIEDAKEKVKETLKKNGAYLPSKAPPKNLVLCRFCPCVCNSTNERTAHERNHGVRSGSAKLDAQYQCPLCSYSSDTDIDAHLGLHLRLAEFHESRANELSISQSDPSVSICWPSDDVDFEVSEKIFHVKDPHPNAIEDQTNSCHLCGIETNDDIELHLLRHQLGSHYLFL